MLTDTTPRYLPGEMIGGGRRGIVTRSVAYPPGKHPAGCPIRADLTAVYVEVTTAVGHEPAVRWFGCLHAYIASDLRMVLVGHNPKDEVRQTWEPVSLALRDIGEETLP